MSKLDTLYANLRRYTDRIGNLKNGAIVTYIQLYSDGGGCVETKRYEPTDANPFHVTTDRIVTFGSPQEGARKLQELLDELENVSKSAGGSTTAGNVELLESSAGDMSAVLLP